VTVREIVDTAADLQVKLVATALQAPTKARATVTAARRRGINGTIGVAASEVLRGSITVATLPFELVERLRHRGPEAVTPPVYAAAATAAGAPGTATAEADAAAREAATREAVRTVSSVDDAGVPVPAHEDLPLPNYDHMTLGSLRGRLVRLSLEDLSRSGPTSRRTPTGWLSSRCWRTASRRSGVSSAPPPTAPATCPSA
jgi:hypothetical protein